MSLGRGMVIGYLEKIPAAAFGKSTQEIVSLIGNSNGVYALHRGNQLYHVGLASGLKRRLRQHILEQQAGKWSSFSLYLMRGGRQLSDVAVLISRVAKPTGAQRLIGFTGAADLTGLLKTKASQVSRVATRKLAMRKRAVLQPVAQRSTTGKGTGIIPLKGLIGQKMLSLTYKGKTYYAAVLTSGRIKLKHNAKIFDTPSGAAREIVKFQTNGWHWWRYRNRQGKWVPIDELRN